MEALQSYLKSYFGILPEHLNQVVNLFEAHELKKGDFYTKEGQYCHKLSFVQSGYVRVYNYSGNKEVTQWISTKGYFLTDLYSFIFDQRARWNMQALTDCWMFTIHKANYTKLPSIISNWHEIEKKFISSCFLTLEDRVFNHLSLSAEERYLQFFEANKEMFQEVPMQYIASMLGMTPETFSRIRKKAIS